MKKLNYSYIKINDCGITHCTKDWNWNPVNQMISDYDIWMVMSGEGSFFVDGEEFIFGGKNVIFLSPNHRYIAKQNLNNRLSVLHIHFDFYNEYDEKIFFDENELPFKVFEANDFDFFEKLMFRVLNNYHSEQKHDIWLECAIMELFKTNTEQFSNNPELENQIKFLCRRMQNSPEKNYKLQKIADRWGYSSDYLGKFFKSVIGVSFSEYMISLRISQAKTNLDYTNYSIKKIAELLGYSDTYFFSKQFKKHTGYSPVQYRNRNK